MLLTFFTTLAVPAFFLSTYACALCYLNLRHVRGDLEIAMTGCGTLAAGTVSLVALSFLVARFVSDV